MSDASSSTASIEPDAPGRLRSAWSIAIGLIIVACGLFALMAPILSTFAMSIVIAITASIAGIVQIAHSFRSKGVSEVILNCLLGLVYIAGGLAFWIWPFTGATFLTMILAWTLVTAGVAQIAIALAFRSEKAWSWMLLSGALALVLGVWLMFRLHIASLFVPGIAWALALLAEGVAILMRALGKEAIETEPEPAAAPAAEPAAEPLSDPDAGRATPPAP
jgi:uncharacterized membrane protein HdeD (DUF308 family)